jgi:hypothetical protein
MRCDGFNGGGIIWPVLGQRVLNGGLRNPAVAGVGLPHPFALAPYLFLSGKYRFESVSPLKMMGRCLPTGRFFFRTASAGGMIVEVPLSLRGAGADGPDLVAVTSVPSV